jgi:hypothetical protein
VTEPFDYRHKDGNSGVTFNSNAELGATSYINFNGGQRANTLVAVPRYIGAEGLRLGTMRWWCSATGDADVRVGIYASTAMKNLYPSSLIIDCGVQSLATGGNKVWTPNTVLTGPGVVWFAWLASTANGQVIGPLSNLTKPSPFTFLGRTQPTSSNHYVGVTVAQAYGVLPATFPAGAALLASNTSPFLPQWDNKVF